MHVSERVRSSTHPYTRGVFPGTSPHGLAGVIQDVPSPGGKGACDDVALGQRSDGANGWPCRDWTSSSRALTIPSGSCGPVDLADIDLPPRSRHAVVPRTFRSWVSRVTQAQSPESLPPEEGMHWQVMQGPQVPS